ncbi:hypothetical protein N4R57_09840 [Rhodobacteraceae bacterium D3-12]|nr:hypothetical protein N4R57_09840 [Rhodobacteraceae bacterium D3-12]
MLVFRSLVFAAMMLCAPGAQAQQVPPPVNLGIINVQQQTPVWCWLAVVEMIAHWKQKTPIQGPPHQCAMVSKANGYGKPICCNPPSQYQNACFRTGHTQEIMQLLQATGAGVASYNPPANPMVLYQTLRSGRPIILQVQSTPFSGHVVVLTGMEWVKTPYGVQPVLHINDPLAHFTQPVPFQQLIPIWSAAIVVN